MTNIRWRASPTPAGERDAVSVELLAAVVGLAIAGADPLGAVIAGVALVRGVGGRWIFGYALAVLCGTASLGTVLSLTVGRRLTRIDWTRVLPPRGAQAVIELALAAALLAWAVLQSRRPVAGDMARPRRVAGPTLVGAGALLTVSALLDPAFDAMVVMLGHGSSLWQVAIAQAVWVLISQVPLIGLLAAMTLGHSEGAASWIQQRLSCWQSRVRRVGTAFLVMAAASLATDAVWCLATGTFLLPRP